MITAGSSPGTSAGYRLGWNQYPSTSGSPVCWSAPTANDSLRSGGVSVPSAYPFASTPGGSQPRPPTVTAYRCLTPAGSAKNARAWARTRARSSGATPCPVTRKNPIRCRASSTCAATPARSWRPPPNQGSRSITGTDVGMLGSGVIAAGLRKSRLPSW